MPEIATIARLPKNSFRKARKVLNCKFEAHPTQMLYLKRVMHFFYNGIGLLLRGDLRSIHDRFWPRLSLQIRPQCLC